MFDRPLAADTIVALANYHGWKVPANPSAAAAATTLIIAEA